MEHCTKGVQVTNATVPSYVHVGVQCLEATDLLSSQKQDPRLIQAVSTALALGDPGECAGWPRHASIIDLLCQSHSSLPDL